MKTLILTACLVGTLICGALAESTESKSISSGQTHSNGDVSVSSQDMPTVTGGTKACKGKAYMDPWENATHGDNTNVRTSKNWAGSIDSLEGGDTVDLGNSNVAVIEAQGGTINVGTNSEVTVHNTNPDPKAPPVVITQTNGSSTYLTSGSSCIIKTP